MTTIFANYINGEWVKGADTFADRNPANTDDVAGCFVKGTAQDMGVWWQGGSGPRCRAWSAMACAGARQHFVQGSRHHGRAL